MPFRVLAQLDPWVYSLRTIALAKRNKIVRLWQSRNSPAQSRVGDCGVERTGSTYVRTFRSGSNGQPISSWRMLVVVSPTIWIRPSNKARDNRELLVGLVDRLNREILAPSKGNLDFTHLQRIEYPGAERPPPV